MDIKNKNRMRPTFSLSHFLTFTGFTGFSLIEVLVAISLMALLALYLGTKGSEVVTEDKFYKTCYRMEEIRDAIIGRRGHYCNGIEQFTGYLSDMGNLPNLYYYGKKEGLMKKVTRIESGRLEANGLAEALKQGHRPQPIGLWKKTGAPEWKYHEQSHMWAGWRGSYIEPQGKDALKDAWGNDFIFVVGEVVGHKNKDDKELTYRCKKTYASTLDNLGRPGESDKWEVINEEGEMNFRIWRDLGTAKETDGSEVVPKERWKTKQEKFYGPGCLTIISLGADNEPGGEGLKKDIQIVIDPTEYQGEVAGHLGGDLPEKVCLYYPNYTEDGGSIEECCLQDIEDNSRMVYVKSGDSFDKSEDPYNTGDLYTGINFRFGTGAGWKEVKDTGIWIRERDDSNLVETNIPTGVRTIRAITEADEGPWYMFFSCPGGNWIGTIR